jgi:hypothetical protein
MPIVSAFTSSGHRVAVPSSSAVIRFVIETERLDLGSEPGVGAFFLAEFGIINGTPLPEATRLIRHFVGYFADDELVTFALDGLKRALAQLRDTPKVDATKVHVGSA